MPVTFENGLKALVRVLVQIEKQLNNIADKLGVGEPVHHLKDACNAIIADEEGGCILLDEPVIEIIGLLDCLRLDSKGSEKDAWAELFVAYKQALAIVIANY